MRAAQKDLLRESKGILERYLRQKEEVEAKWRERERRFRRGMFANILGIVLVSISTAFPLWIGAILAAAGIALIIVALRLANL